jgi:hypothetical protein
MLMGPVDEALCAVTGAGSTRGRSGSVAGARLSGREGSDGGRPARRRMHGGQSCSS